MARNVELRAGDGDEAFVSAWRDELLPAIEDFSPEAIVVSAGYDAHAADPLAELEVTEAGYEAVARSLGETAARLGIAGVALTLEGGYDLDQGHDVDALFEQHAIDVGILLRARFRPAPFCRR